MLGFSEKCPVCKMAVKKGKGVKRLGKVFCSDDCAKEYEKQQSK